MKSVGMVLIGVLAAFYLINPTAGFFEIIPDNIPFIGNLDEVGATAILLAVLRYFGIDLTRFFARRLGTSPKAKRNKTA